MEGKKVAPTSRLYSHTLLDVKDENEERYEKAATTLQNMVANKGEKELNDALSVAVAKDTKSHDDICTGFLVLILTEPDNAPKHYKHLTLVSRDCFNFVVHELSKLISEKYIKLKEEVRKQLLWFIREMIKNQVSNIDGLCWTLMRQIAGGDLSQKNLWLADTLMDLYIEHRVWLEKFQFLLLSVVYTYLRIIEDHAHANLAALRNKEVSFVVTLIRDRFTEVVNIGRDFVRLLQNIARIPEVEELWHDMLHNPTTLSPTFTGITQIMRTRTSRRFLQSRITPHMETKLVYLTSQVRFGSHKRYQDWFQKSYLNAMESQTLRCDLIRFIVGVIHPTNELLCSDIIPRWAVIGWLLTTCTNPVAASNAKLALFYDWLFFDPEKDNIMNIEPAILVMHHSIRPHPAITATLLDFLCRIINNFYPAGIDQVRNGIYSSLTQIVDKKVLSSLGPLFDNQRLDKELRSMLKDKFGPFLKKEESIDLSGDKDDIIALDHDSSGPTPAFSDDEDDDITVTSVSGSMMSVVGSGNISGIIPPEEISILPTSAPAPVLPKTVQPVTVTSAPPATVNAPVVTKSDIQPLPVLGNNGITDVYPTTATVNNGESKPNSKKQDPYMPNNKKQETFMSSITKQETSVTNNKKQEGFMFMNKKQESFMSNNKKQDNSALNTNGDRDEEVDSSILDKLDELQQESSNEKGCEIMDQLVRILCQEQVYGEEARQVAEKLSHILRNEFEGKIFPEDTTSESIEDSVGQPLFVIFRTLCEISDIDPQRQPILTVLAELYGLQPRLGYYLLYFLKTYNKLDAKSKANLYKDLCEAIDDNNSLDICLVNDMRQCQEDDVSLFVYLVPDIYMNFQKAAIGNEDLLYLVVSCVDGRHIQTLVSHIIARDFIMFRKDSFQPVISISLTWETFEQYALWQLLNSHDIPIDCIMPLIPRLSYHEHAEALTHFMHILRREKPTTELIKHLMSRDPLPRDMFVNCVLNNWLAGQTDDIKKLGELISTQLSKQASPAGGKRKRMTHTNKSPNSLGALAEMTLGHMDILRQHCKNYDLFNLRSIQHALQNVRSLCTDFQKKKYSDLFALADSESDDEEDSNPKQRSKNTNNRLGRSPLKPGRKGGAGGTSSAAISTGFNGGGGSKERNSESSDITESEEEELPPIKGKRGSKAKAPRKRTNKVSYREMESTDQDTDEDDIKKTPKKRKKMSSDSD